MSTAVKTQVDERWTVDDLERFPDGDGNRFGYTLTPSGLGEAAPLSPSNDL